MGETLKKLSGNLFDGLLAALSDGEKMGADDWRMLLDGPDEAQREELRRRARETAVSQFGTGVYIRGLIEISSWCRNDCYYCGLRRSNRNASRYRLSADEIRECCRYGARLGFGTFVLQGGEDEAQDDAWVEELVRAIRAEFPDKAITLSVGERTAEAYRRFREAGADRYLLRHETRDDAHYAALHPASMSGAHRRECLYTLKSLGYQTGAGMMVGTPGQTTAHLVQDLLFLDDLRPQMIGIGPFIPAAHTPFARQAPGSVTLTCHLLALLRLRFPRVLLPSTTALATLVSGGRAAGILSGANVVMPNLSPAAVRERYSIYDRKLADGGESAEGLDLLEKELNDIGYHIAYGRGDYPQR